MWSRSHLDKVLALVNEWVVSAQGHLPLVQAVHAGLAPGPLLLVCPKEPVPNDKHAPVVAAGVIAGVVHPVVGGRVHDPLDRAQAPDELRVDPELVQGVDGSEVEVHLREALARR